MMSDSTTSPAPAATEPNQFTLQILSPSINVPQPLSLSLTATTTVRQLKERIRNAISAKPPDDAQRLIHRGRLLARDTETMLELFGEEALQSPDRLVLHLVLRDLTEQQTPTPPPASSEPPSSRPQTSGHHQNHQHHQHNGQHYLRLNAHPNIAFGFPQAPGALNGTQLPPGMTTQQLLQNQMQTMARLGLPNQHQTQHPVLNTTGYGTQNWGAPGSTTPGRVGSPFQPETTRTVIREGIGPDGQRWRFTVNESIVASTHRPGRTGSPLSSSESLHPATSQLRPMANTGPMGSHDAQSIFRTADAGSATRVMANAMRRNASSSSLANLASYQGQQPIPPGVTTPLIQSRAGSAAGTPDPLRAIGRSTNQTSPPAPEVYILSSPSGPHAVLLSGNQGNYYSPQLRGFQSTGLPPAPTLSNFMSGGTQHIRHEAIPQILPRPSLATSSAPNPHLNDPRPGQQPPLQPQHEVQVPGPIQPQIGHGMDNPQVQAIRLAQVWPHIWMIVRLSVFIWWFTSPTASWSRWITVISIAITLFLLNVGALDPLAVQVWLPLRRHLENLIPRAGDADDHQQQRPAGGNVQGGVNGANPANPRDLDPADAAARLVQQRRQDRADQLLELIRRFERAGILFLASLAPGLAERHIAQVEAEARAERQRLQEAEAAATATAPAEDLSGSANNGSADAPNPETREPAPGNDIPDREAGPSNNATRPDAPTPAQEASA